MDRTEDIRRAFIIGGYGTSFQVLLIAALESALGTDAGLSEYPGFWNQLALWNL